MNRLTIFGTGHAMTTKCYNTCFTLENDEGLMMVDGGGGNYTLTLAEKAGIDLADVHDLIVTHAHTDHLLGALWVLRALTEYEKGGECRIYSNDVVKELLVRYIDDLFFSTRKKYADKNFRFIEVDDGDRAEILGMDTVFFDIHSTKAKQTGFSMTLNDGQKFTCLGDEPYNPLCEKYVRDSDWLLAEAFCLYEDRDIYRPYEINHSTALDAGKVAQELGVKNLLIYHTEDSDLEHRRERYTKEAAEHFRGNIFVPDDLDVIDL